MPAYPSAAEHTAILAASELTSEPVQLTDVSGEETRGPASTSTVGTLRTHKKQLTLTLGKHSVVAVDVDFL